ncbi:MAG TPA: GNAT family N-acetyltransferase [bacterium]
MTVEIRRATLKDIKEILPVWGELAVFHSTLDPAFTPSAQWPREYGTYLRSLMTRDDAIALVARDAGEIVGYAVGRVTMLPPFFEQRYRGYIHDVFVKPQFRRRGVGRRLVDAILQWLRQQEVLLVELTVATNNEAVAFWKRLGFSVYMQQMKKDLQDERVSSRNKAET